MPKPFYTPFAFELMLRFIDMLEEDIRKGDDFWFGRSKEDERFGLQFLFNQMF